MAFYESTFIARQELSTQEVDKITEYFTKVINDNNGKIVKTEYWGLRSLAYTIKKGRKGHYVFFGLDAPGTLIKELERQLKLHEDVIRSLVVKVEAISEEASPVLNSNNNSGNNNSSYADRKGNDSNV